jgi:hypothetical protein
MAKMSAPSDLKFAVGQGVAIGSALSAIKDPNVPRIELSGASGLLDYDVARGSRRGLFEMWCVSKPDVQTGAQDFISAGVVFDYSTSEDGSVSGTFDTDACQ